MVYGLQPLSHRDHCCDRLVKPSIGAMLHLMSVALSAHDLVGRYQLHRRLIPGGVFIGTAEISLSNNLNDDHKVLDYHEQGVLSLEGPASTSAAQSFTAERRYRLHPSDKALSIFFAGDTRDGGGLFQEFTLQHRGQTLVGMADHWCAPDHYRSRYLFASSTALIVHQVTGPRKHYLSITRLRRDR